MRQPLHLVVPPVPRQGLQRLDNPGVQHAPPLLQQTAIRHLMGEGMLEGIGVLGKQAGLVEELCCLQMCQTTVQRLVGRVGDDLQQRPGHLGADDRGSLEQAFLLRWQPIDARRHSACTVAGTCNVSSGWATS